MSSYQVTIKNADTNAVVYTGSTISSVKYNGETLEMPIPANSFTNGLNLTWKARLTQTNSDIKVVTGRVQSGGSSTITRIRPNLGIKVGMYLSVGAQSKLISAYANALQISTSTLGSGSTYTDIKIATGLSSANVLGYSLFITNLSSGIKRTITAYNSTTGVATVVPGFSTQYASGTTYVIADEKIATVTTSAFSPVPSLNDTYTVLSSFIDTPNYYFKSRLLPTITTFSLISGITTSNSSGANIPIRTGLVQGTNMLFFSSIYTLGLSCTSYNSTTGVWSYSTTLPIAVPSGTAYTVQAGITSPLPSRIGNFTTTYTQAQGVGVKYYIYNLYNETGVLLDTTGQVYSSLLTYSYDAFLSGSQYSLEVIVVNQDNVEVESGIQSFSVSYGTPDLSIPPTVEIKRDLNAIQVDWISDKQAIGVATGTTSFVTDFPFAGTNSVNIQSGTVTFSEISGTPLDIDTTAYGILSNINTPINKIGNLLRLYDTNVGGYGDLILKIENFILYRTILDPYGKSIYAPSFTDVISTATIPTSSWLTVSGTPTAGTGYIWDDTATWDDTKIWTETPDTDTIQLKVTMLPSYSIQVKKVT